MSYDRLENFYLQVKSIIREKMVKWTKKGQTTFLNGIRRSFPYVLLAGFLIYFFFVYTSFTINLKFISLAYLASFWIVYFYLMDDVKKLSKKDKEELKVGVTYLAVLTVVLILRFILSIPIISSTTPTPNPPAVTDSPDPQQGGLAVTFSCSSCSSGATGEYMKLLICKSNSNSCVLESQWGYKRSITINNTQNSNALTEYQVLVKLDTASLISAGKMRSDCGDIRFTDSDGTTQLSYWLESGCNSASTKIWVKVPSIPASSTKTIYLYYGNPDATSVSNGTSTFLFFDDFLGTTLDTNKWTIIWNDGYATLTVGNGILSIYDNVSHGAWYALSIRSIPSFTSNIAVESRVNYVYSLTYPNSHRWLGLRDISSYPFSNLDGRATQSPNIVASDYLRAAWLSASGYSQFSLTTRISGTEYSSLFTGTWNSFIRQSIIWTPSSAKIYEDGVLKSENTNVPSTSLSVGIELDRGANAGNAGIEVDWVAVRKYSSPEPTTSVGAETTTQPSNYLWTQSTAVQSGPSASYTCPSCTYSINTYYGVSYNINETVWTSFANAQTFTCKKENLCSCTSNDECFNSCKLDPDNSGSWCCNSNQCAHDGTCGSIVELVNLPGGNACVEGENIAHNSAGTQHPRYAAYDGQLYYCGTSSSDKSPYSQVTNLIPTDSIGNCVCGFDGNFYCSSVINIRKGRIRIVS